MKVPSVLVSRHGSVIFHSIATVVRVAVLLVSCSDAIAKHSNV